MKHTTQWNVFALRNAYTHKSNCKHPVRRFNHCKKSNFRSFFRFVSKKAHFLLILLFLVFFIFFFLFICRVLVAAAVVVAASICRRYTNPFGEMHLFCIHTHLSYGDGERIMCVSAVWVWLCIAPHLRISSSLPMLFLCSFFHHFYLLASVWASSVQQIAAWQSSINSHNCCWMHCTTTCTGNAI